MKIYKNTVLGIIGIAILSGCTQANPESAPPIEEPSKTYVVTDPYADYYDILCGNSVLPSEEDIQSDVTLTDTQKEEAIAWIKSAPVEVITKSRKNSAGVPPASIASVQDPKCTR